MRVAEFVKRGEVPADLPLALHVVLHIAIHFDNSDVGIDQKVVVNVLAFIRLDLALAFFPGALVQADQGPEVLGLALRQQRFPFGDGLEERVRGRVHSLYPGLDAFQRKKDASFVANRFCYVQE